MVPFYFIDDPLFGSLLLYRTHLDWKLDPCDMIHRIGESSPSHNRCQQIFLEVCPESAVWDVWIGCSPNLNVSVIARIEQYIQLSVAGTHPSETKGDEWIRAFVQGTEHDQEFSVVIPGGIGTPHPEPDSDVTPRWRFLDDTTSPRSTDPTPSIPVPTPGQQVWKAGVAEYCHYLDIPVVDQLGDPIDDFFEDSIVEEEFGSVWVSINQKLNQDRSYMDSVGWCPAVAFYPVPSQDATDFLNQTYVPPIPTRIPESATQEMNIRVDGIYVLKPAPAITGRVIWARRGCYRVRIDWPD